MIPLGIEEMNVYAGTAYLDVMMLACYAGTAGFQIVVNFILYQVALGTKTLLIASDISCFW